MAIEVKKGNSESGRLIPEDGDKMTKSEISNIFKKGSQKDGLDFSKKVFKQKELSADHIDVHGNASTDHERESKEVSNKRDLPAATSFEKQTYLSSTENLSSTGPTGTIPVEQSSQVHGTPKSGEKQPPQENWKTDRERDYHGDLRSDKGLSMAQSMTQDRSYVGIDRFSGTGSHNEKNTVTTRAFPSDTSSVVQQADLSSTEKLSSTGPTSMIPGNQSLDETLKGHQSDLTPIEKVSRENSKAEMKGSMTDNVLPMPSNIFSKGQEKKSVTEKIIVGDDIPITPGQAMINTMQAQHVGPVAMDPVQTIKSLAIQVAERILATNEALNAKQEVRITIQDNILRNTEAVISKDNKNLTVAFISGARESVDILNQRGGDLRSQLLDRFPDINRVDIEVEYHPRDDGRGQDRHSGGRNQDRDQQDEDQQD